MTLCNTIRDAARRRAAYHRTRREIAGMPLDVALDLEIAREDAATLARRAVYGA